MKVLIAFGTTEGQTRKIARHVQRFVEGARHLVELYDCSRDGVGCAVEAFDAVILAASVHHRRYQSGLYGFVSSNLAALQTRPLAFVSVSLAVTLADGETEARSYVDDFLAETDLRTDAVHLAEGAIRYFEYGRSEAQTIELVVFKSQKKMPPRDGNPEYTDWKALDHFTAGFLKDAETRSRAT